MAQSAPPTPTPPPQPPPEPQEFLYVVRQRCYGLGALFVGSSGGALLAALSDVHKTDPLYTVTDKKEVKPFLKSIPNAKYFIGSRNPWVRFALQGLGCAWCYSFLECRFQRGHLRTIFDAALAGAITGGAFGLRGTPGGTLGAGYGAAGFAAYALIVQLLIR